MTYDDWKTTPPDDDREECADGCGRAATTDLDGMPLCAECVQEYHPDL